MLPRARLAEVAKLAGIEPKAAVRVPGTSAKLATKQRPKKALRLGAKIRARSNASKTKIATRQKSPTSKLYGKRKKPFEVKTAFLRKGESALTTLVGQVRDLLAEGS